jgi:two-component system, chemotaxis family, chemotaxis protein CheY
MMTAMSHTLRALLVDRDKDTRLLYGQHLRQAGWDIDEADDGRDALAKALSRHYDVIVTETRLPGIDGYQFCALLRRDVTTQTVPVVIVSAEANQADEARAHRAGANIVLAKPCLPETLLGEIGRLLDESRSREARSHESGGTTRGSIADQHATDPLTLGRRQMLSRTHQRGDTTVPPAAPPTLLCPVCDKPLMYQRSHVGGVSARHPEQWDYYACPTGCGTFEYRQRTRKLRNAG